MVEGPIRNHSAFVRTLCPQSIGSLSIVELMHWFSRSLAQPRIGIWFELRDKSFDGGAQKNLTLEMCKWPEKECFNQRCACCCWWCRDCRRLPFTRVLATNLSIEDTIRFRTLYHRVSTAIARAVIYQKKRKKRFVHLSHSIRARPKTITHKQSLRSVFVSHASDSNALRNAQRSSKA